ncbi:MAG: FAD binding domain-containing protein, partial [Gammaproteobacteria bacterium]|nr:FAD binding domain-containing protein [Gammaproteobacteria bacterium]
MRGVKYAAPDSVDDAVALLAEYGDRARMLAGGTDLIVQVREWARDIDVMVDAKKISELMDISFAGNGELTLGAATPCYRIYADDRIKDSYPALVDAVSMIGGTAVQGRASVGGNLCNSGPAGDSIPPLIVYSVQCNIAGPSGRRSVPAEDFCTGPGSNVLESDELLVSLTFPPQDPG